MELNGSLSNGCVPMAMCGWRSVELIDVLSGIFDNREPFLNTSKFEQLGTFAVRSMGLCGSLVHLSTRKLFFLRTFNEKGIINSL